MEGLEAKFDSKCTFRGAMMSHGFSKYLESIFGKEHPALRNVVVEQEVAIGQDVVIEQEEVNAGS